MRQAVPRYFFILSVPCMLLLPRTKNLYAFRYGNVKWFPHFPYQFRSLCLNATPGYIKSARQHNGESEFLNSNIQIHIKKKKKEKERKEKRKKWKKEKEKDETKENIVNIYDRSISFFFLHNSTFINDSFPPSWISGSELYQVRWAKLYIVVHVKNSKSKWK